MHHLCESESESVSDDDTTNSRNKPEAERDEARASQEDKDFVKLLDEEDRPEVARKEVIRKWPELQGQVKEDLEHAYKQHAPASQINQLLILQNFANLQMKGLGRMVASKEIARQWHEGRGVSFSCQVWILAHHYELYEQLPVEKRGGDTGQSLLNDEHVQKMARTYLTSLPTGEVTPKNFQHALNVLLALRSPARPDLPRLM